MQQYSQPIIFVLIIAAFYLLLIRPQQQAAKHQRELVAELEPGAEIMTIGGLYATVVSVTGDRVRVAVADGSELEFAKRAVSSLVKPEPEPEPEPEDLEADAEEADAEEARAQDADSGSPASGGAPAIDGGFTAAEATGSDSEGDAPDA